MPTFITTTFGTGTGTAAAAPTLDDAALCTAAAAVFLGGLAPKTLVNWRNAGIGPAYVKYHGRRIAYLQRDLIAFRDVNRIATAA